MSKSQVIVIPIPGKQQPHEPPLPELHQPPTDKFIRRGAQFAKDIEAARLKMEREPRGRAENRRADARVAAQEGELRQEVATPPSAAAAIYEPISYKKAIAGKEHNAWVSATQHEFSSQIQNGT